MNEILMGSFLFFLLLFVACCDVSKNERSVDRSSVIASLRHHFEIIYFRVPCRLAPRVDEDYHSTVLVPYS